MPLFLRLALVLGLLGFSSAPLWAADGAPYRVGAGVNLGGGQLDWRLNRKWMVEVRGQAAKAGDANNTRASLFGLRGYRFFNAGRPSIFAGLEAASITARQSASGPRATGFAAGAFGGVELRVIPHVFLLLDAGPYFISLKEDRTNMSDGSVDFVADAALVAGF